MQSADRRHGLAVLGALVACISSLAACGSTPGDADTDEATSQTAGAEGELSTVNARVATYYAANYDAVKRDALGWFGTTHDGCVAFASTAINRTLTPTANSNGTNAGRYIPHGLQFDDGNVATWTSSFSAYLQKEHGWTRIAKSSDLQSGDEVFTIPQATPNHPNHTFVFHSWDDRAHGTANVLDNQVRGLHLRDVSPSASPGRRFWYALRAPAQAMPAIPDSRVSCTEDSDCYGDAEPGTERNVCSDTGDTAGFCIDACHSDDDCKTGDVCGQTSPHYSCQAPDGPDAND